MASMNQMQKTSPLRYMADQLHQRVVLAIKVNNGRKWQLVQVMPIKDNQVKVYYED